MSTFFDFVDTFCQRVDSVDISFLPLRYLSFDTSCRKNFRIIYSGTHTAYANWYHLRFLSFLESLDKKLRNEISLLDNKETLGKITVKRSTLPTQLNYDNDPAFSKLKAGLDARMELLKQQYKLHLKHSKNNPEKEFIGIVEDTGEQVVIVSRKEGTGREIINLTVRS